MADDTPQMISLADHPRAAASIRTAKGFGGLIGFAVVGIGSYVHGSPVPDSLLRAVVGGIAGQMLAWFGAVVAWRHILDGEAQAVVRRAAELRQARAEQR